MPRVCAATFCKNRYLSSDNLSFFRFPTDDELFNLWLTRCGRSDLIDNPPKNKSYLRLCEEHFKEEDVILFKGVKRLKSKALPQNVLTLKVNSWNVSSESTNVYQPYHSEVAAAEGIPPAEASTDLDGLIKQSKLTEVVLDKQKDLSISIVESDDVLEKAVHTINFNSEDSNKGLCSVVEESITAVDRANSIDMCGRRARKRLRNKHKDIYLSKVQVKKDKDDPSVIASRKRSGIWKFYTLIDSSTARCETCQSHLSFHGGSTTNLHRHLKIKHSTSSSVHKQEPSEQEMDAVSTIQINKTDEVVTELPESRSSLGSCKKKTSAAQRRRSIIWKFYSVVDGTRAKCRTCQASVSFTGGSITNLRRHIKIRHPHVKVPEKYELHDPNDLEASLILIDQKPSEVRTESPRDFSTQLHSYKKIPISERKQSGIWDFFSIVDSNRARCEMCLSELSFSGGSTTNLRRHVRLKHPYIEVPARRERIELETVDDLSTPESISVHRMDHDEGEITTTVSSPKVPKRKRSDVWKFYTFINENRVRCSTCRSELAYHGGTTTNLRRHLKSKHPNVRVVKKTQISKEETIESSNYTPGEIVVHIGQNCDGTTTTEFSDVKPKKIEDGRAKIISFKRIPPVNHKKVDEALFEMIAKDYQPFSIVDDAGFRRFTQLLNPTYRLPNSKTLSQSVLPQMYKRTLDETKQRLHSAESICLTTDSWTSAATINNYISVTCHFINDDYALESCLLDCFSYSEHDTAEVLKSELLRVAKDWEVVNKIVAVVTPDNSTNIVAAVKLAGWKHLPCFAHTLNVIVGEALKKIKPVIEKVKGIVEYIRRSTATAEKFRLTQRILAVGEQELKQDMPARWNSTYYMLERFCQQKEAITITMELLNPSYPLLSTEEWDIVKESCNILKPFEEVTMEISSEQSVSASKVIIMARGLQKVSNNISSERQLRQPVRDMLHKLKENMAQRFHNIEKRTLFSESSIMDPRFKKFAFFIDEKAAEEAIERITSAASHLNEVKEENEVTSSITQTSSAMFWDVFDNRAEAVPLQSSKSEAITEVRSFIEEPLLPKNEDPLQWWRVRRYLYKRLNKIMFSKLCVVATSVPSGQIFTKAGQVISDRRNCLSPSTVREIVFLNGNLR